MSSLQISSSVHSSQLLQTEVDTGERDVSIQTRRVRAQQTFV